MKKILYPTALLVIIGSLLIASSISLSLGQVSTEVSGIITSNTTWTKTGGPYRLVGPVTVSSGVTLTIQAGTSILLDNYYLLVNGTLRAQGLATDLITIQNGTGSVDSRGNPIYPITFSPFSTAWNEQLRTGSILEYAVLRSTSVYITASPKLNANTFDNSFIGISNYTLSAEPPYPAGPTISNNTMKSTSTFMSAIITFNSIGSITSNNISGYTTAIEMHSDAGTNVQNNLILNNVNGIQLVAQKGPVLAIIRNNTITSNTVGILLAKLSTSATNPTIQYNNIYSNTNSNVNSSVPDNVNAINNWWGTTTTSAINQSIWDFKRDPTTGNVTFVPFLTAANPAAPSPQPTPTPTPIVTPTPTPTPQITPTMTPPTTNQPTPTPTPSITNTPSTTATPTSGVSPTPTNPPTTTPTQSPTANPTQTAQNTPLPTSSANGTQGSSNTALYAGVAAVVIIIIIIAVVLLIRKRS